MREVGQIVEIQEQKARIRMESRGGCSHCGMKGLCRSAGDGIRELTLDTAGMTIRDGDTVEIETPARSVLMASFLVFILPLLLSIAAYFIAVGITTKADAGLLAFFLCFIVSEGLVAAIDRLFGRGKTFEPRIVRRIVQDQPTRQDFS